LQRWSFRPESPLSLRAKVTKLSVADLERLAKADYPITGDLSGEIALTGSDAAAGWARLATANESFGLERTWSEFEVGFSW